MRMFLKRNAFVRFGTVPASDFHWRDLLYTICGYAYGILIVRFGTAPVLLVHWTILRLRFVFPFGACERMNGNENKLHCDQCLLFFKAL